MFLDRDGVLNQAVVRDGKPYPPSGLAGFELLPGVAEACRTLKEAGFLLIVVTNQPDISRGTQSREAVDSMNARLREWLPLDEIRVCEHDDKEDCACRKPKPGLLTGAAEAWNIDLANSFMVGDRWRDVAAGRNAGCRTVWIDLGYKERPAEGFEFRSNSLPEAVRWIQQQ